MLGAVLLPAPPSSPSASSVPRLRAALATAEGPSSTRGGRRAARRKHRAVHRLTSRRRTSRCSSRADMERCSGWRADHVRSGSIRSKAPAAKRGGPIRGCRVISAGRSMAEHCLLPHVAPSTATRWCRRHLVGSPRRQPGGSDETPWQVDAALTCVLHPVGRGAIPWRGADIPAGAARRARAAIAGRAGSASLFAISRSG